MKIVLNRCFGGFGLSAYAEKKLGHNSGYYDGNRTDAALITLVIAEPEKVSGRYAELEIIEIPDTATDWEIEEYDGNESIIYVLDGKIHHA